MKSDCDKQTAAPPRWPEGLPRVWECVFSLLLLIILSPVMLVCGIGVRVTAGRPVFFKQYRVGRNGTQFRLIKFRSMTHGSGGPGITAADDRRVTVFGRILRKTKLDELPELYNILVGDMSFVGPRPESPEYVDLNDPRWCAVLAARPGLTDPVTVRLRDEEAILAGVTGDRDRFYREVLQPFKLKGYLDYLANRHAFGDIHILMTTVKSVLFPQTVSPPTLEELEKQMDTQNSGRKL